VLSRVDCFEVSGGPSTMAKLITRMAGCREMCSICLYVLHFMDKLKDAIIIFTRIEKAIGGQMRDTADHGGYKFIAYVLTILPHILNLQNNS